MKHGTSHRRLIRFVVLALTLFLVGEVVRRRLNTHSKSLLRLDYVIPLSRSMNELALTYPDTFKVPDEERLTVEETVGAALSDEGTPAFITRRANPQASAQLWDIIQIRDDGIYQIQSNCYRFLGYIGTDADAARMLDELRSYSGVLNNADRGRVHGIFGGLGTMELRGIDAAVQGLNEMSDVSYWKGRFQYRPENLRPEGVLPPEVENVCLTFQAQAIWRSDEWPPNFKRMLAGITNKAHREQILSRFDLPTIRRGYANAVVLVQKPVTENHRRWLQKSYEQREAWLISISKVQREMWDRPDVHSWLRPRPLPQ